LGKTYKAEQTLGFKQTSCKTADESVKRLCVEVEKIQEVIGKPDPNLDSLLSDVAQDSWIFPKR